MNCDYGQLSDKAKAFLRDVEARKQAQPEVSASVDGRAELAARMNTPYVCSKGHRFSLREADRRRSCVGCCPQCGDVNMDIRMVTANDIEPPRATRDIIDRLKAPLILTGQPLVADEAFFDRESALLAAEEGIVDPGPSSCVLGHDSGQDELPIWAQPVDGAGPEDEY